MFRGLLSALLNLPYWLLWIACVLLILPVLLNVPGKPTPWEMVFYFALLGAVTGYPLLLPSLALEERRARRAGNIGRADTLRWRRRASFLAVLAILGTFFGIMYAQDAAHPVASGQERFRGTLATALMYGETRWLQQQLDDGAVVDQSIDQDHSTAAMQARFGSWRLVLSLLQRGANPSRTNLRGDSVRSLTIEGRLDPADLQAAAALAEVRAFLARQDQRQP